MIQYSLFFITNKIYFENQGLSMSTTLYTFYFNINVGLLPFCYFRQHLFCSLCAIEKNFCLFISILVDNYLLTNLFLYRFALVEGIKLVRIVHCLYAIFCLSMNLEVVRLFDGLFLVFMVYEALILP